MAAALLCSRIRDSLWYSDSVLLPGATVSTWSMIALIVAASTAGDVLTARAMKQVGDLDEIRARAGLAGAAKAVLASTTFLAGVFFLALGFFALLTALSWADVSLVDPRRLHSPSCRMQSPPASSCTRTS